MHTRTLLRLMILPLAAAAFAGCASSLLQPAFRSDVKTGPKPWTSQEFLKDSLFRFAIVADRCGGSRTGVFETAVGKLNLLQPEFVMCVGDNIEGYTSKEDEILKEWDEFSTILRRLEMPFFFVAGNHDVASKNEIRIWEEKFGPRYYSFIYHDTLFLCLDTQDKSGLNPESKDQDAPNLTEEQIAWAEKAIRQHGRVRWTFVFMHKPLWLYDEHDTNNTPALMHSELAKSKNTGFGRIEAALKGRDYTVFAGHTHIYTHYRRNGHDYINLCTTGGVLSSEKNPHPVGEQYGKVDLCTWVTMTPYGPRFANLTLDGILPVDFYNEAHNRFLNTLAAMKAGDVPDRDAPLRLAVPVKNPFKGNLRLRVDWPAVNRADWDIHASWTEKTLRPGEEALLDLEARCVSASAYPVTPACRLQYEAGRKIAAELPLRFSPDQWIAHRRPVTTAHKAAVPPQLNGKLDDAAWTNAASIPEFYAYRMDRPVAVGTRSWLAWNSTNLFVAFQCDEPSMSQLAAKKRARDDESLYEDDTVDVLISPEEGSANYFHFSVNATGAVYDAIGRSPKTFDSQAKVATRMEKDQWIVEMAIPWKDLAVSPTPGMKMGLQVARSRSQSGEIFQFPPLNTNNHTVARHGFLELAE
jgi:predicted phosphodiesterase